MVALLPISGLLALVLGVLIQLRVRDPGTAVPARLSRPEIRPAGVDLRGVATVTYAGIRSHGGAHLDVRARLQRSTDGLLTAAPEFSAARTLSYGQRKVLVASGVVVAVGLVLFTQATLVAFATVLTLVYTAVLVFRIQLFRLALDPSTGDSDGLIDIPDEVALSVPATALPIYTVLVPVYREGPMVLDRLIASLELLDYPRERLDVKLLLEEDDDYTIAAAEHFSRSWIEKVLVPAGLPRTKPKACNYGLTTARGELVTVFDAEDRPEPLQLRRAVVAFRQAPLTLACLQAELSYFNPDQNLITRWFTVEYAMWFSQFLPGLTRMGAPLPLGGTSCHFRRDVLVGAGAWDPYNVTEDADLGIRLHRLGYRTAVLRSVTLEEANSDFVNWIKQRSRWYKGYLQTWLVHMRQPKRLRAEVGTKAAIRFSLFVGGTPLLAVLNPVFWTLTFLWFLAKPAFIAAMFPAPLYYLALFCWLAGNFVILYASLLTALKMDRFNLFIAAALVPVYWVMMSLAAVKAVLQLVQDAQYWEKTEHGLDLVAAQHSSEVARAS